MSTIRIKFEQVKSPDKKGVFSFSEINKKNSPATSQPKFIDELNRRNKAITCTD